MTKPTQGGLLRFWTMATDWTAIKLEYVHGTETMRELAERKGIKAAGLMKRAASEGWEAERKQKSAEVSKTVSDALTEAKVDELSAYNAADLQAAKEIRAKALLMMQSASSPADIRAVAGSVETASKVARLALGVPTENSAITTKELPSSVDEFV